MENKFLTKEDLLDFCIGQGSIDDVKEILASIAWDHFDMRFGAFDCHGDEEAENYLKRCIYNDLLCDGFSWSRNYFDQSLRDMIGENSFYIVLYDEKDRHKNKTYYVFDYDEFEDLKNNCLDDVDDLKEHFITYDEYRDIEKIASKLIFPEVYKDKVEMTINSGKTGDTWS